MNTKYYRLTDFPSHDNDLATKEIQIFKVETDKGYESLYSLYTKGINSRNQYSFAPAWMYIDTVMSVGQVLELWDKVEVLSEDEIKMILLN